MYIDDHLCGTISYSSGKTSYEIQCGRSGKTVKIAQDSYRYPLTLCEVEAYGSPAPVESDESAATDQSAAVQTTKELTFSGATQSWTLWGGAASRAIDGNTDGRYSQR